MDDFISIASDLIEAVEDSPVRLIAFIVLVVVVPIYYLSQDSSSPDKLKAIWSLIAFGAFCVASVLISTTTVVPSVEFSSPLRSLSLVNWIGFWVGGIGLIELISSLRSGSGVQINPGLPLFMIGIGIFLWNTSTIEHPLKLVSGVIARSCGCFGVSLLVEGLFLSRYSSLKFEASRTASVYLGIFLMVIWLLMQMLGRAA